MMSVVSVQEIEDYVDTKISGILIEKKAPPTNIQAHIQDGSGQSAATTIETEAMPLNEHEKVHIHQPSQQHHIQFDLESHNSHQFLYEQLNSASNRHRVNSSRIRRTPSSDSEQPLFVTHITLSLNHLGGNNSGNSNRPTAGWKYNTIRKNPFPNAYYSRADAALRR